MLKFFQLMVPVAMLRRGPDQLPYSTSLFATALAASFALALMTAALASDSVPGTALRYGVSAGFFVACVCLLLYLNKLQNRILQTLTAVFGASAVFSLLDVVLLLFGQLGLTENLRIFVLMLLLVWSLVVDGFILSVALNSTLLIGCMLALVIFIPQLSLVAALGPVSP